MATSQMQDIFNYLCAGHTITGLEALNRFGCMHLPRRMLDIKERIGADAILTATVKLDNGKWVAEHRLAITPAEARVRWGNNYIERALDERQAIEQ